MQGFGAARLFSSILRLVPGPRSAMILRPHVTNGPIFSPDWNSMDRDEQLKAVRHHFTSKKYVHLKSVLVDPLLMTTYRYALMKARIGDMRPDKMVPGTPGMYSDTLMEILLEVLCPVVENATGLKLFPTYSYFRVYQDGDVLDPHTDRPSCEISMTVTLGYQAPKPWQMWFKIDGQPTTVDFTPGDAVVYRGIEVLHWRNAFEGENQAQVFLHYVDQNGPNAEWTLDKRPELGLRTRTENQ